MEYSIPEIENLGPQPGTDFVQDVQAGQDLAPEPQDLTAAQIAEMAAPTPTIPAPKPPVSERIRLQRLNAAAAAREALARKRAAGLTLGNGKTAREKVKAAGIGRPKLRPELPKGKYWISRAKAQKRLAATGTLPPGAMVWDPQNTLKLKPASKLTPTKSTTTTVKRTPRTVTSTKGAALAHAHVIDPTLVSYTAGYIQNELHHLAEKHGVPSGEFAAQVGAYLSAHTRG